MIFPQTNSLAITVGVSGGGVFIAPPTYTNSRSFSDYNSSSYLSSALTASNGTLNINTKEDTNIIGSSLLAQDIVLTTKNLNLESLQSKTTSSSESNSIS